MDSLENKFINISKVQYRYIQCLIHFLFLNVNINSGNIPKGLRIKSNLSATCSNTSLEYLWKETLYRSSTQLMHLLATHYCYEQNILYNDLHTLLCEFKDIENNRTRAFMNILYLQAKTSWQELSRTKINKLINYNITLFDPNVMILQNFHTTKLFLYYQQFFLPTNLTYYANTTCLNHNHSFIENSANSPVCTNNDISSARSVTNNNNITPPVPPIKHKHNRRFIKHTIYKKRLTNVCSKTVINLSSHQLTEHQSNVLSKNINFCPTPSRVNTVELSNDIFKFCRRLRLAEYFFDKDDDITDETTSTTKPSFLKHHSTFTPPSGRDLSLDAFIKSFSQEVISAPSKKTYSNLSREENIALRELKENPNITIKPSDKGGAVVVMDTTSYIEECSKQLSNPLYYEQVGVDANKSCSAAIKSTLEQAVDNREIDPNDADKLITPNPVPGRFYILPKVHKEGNPGRPIISGNGTPTERISQYVDYHLKDLVSTLPSYVQDDMDFLRKVHEINLDGPLPAETILCTMDVTGLYTNIPHKEGTDACYTMLENHLIPNQKPSPSLISRLINLILSFNIFTFGEQSWRQVHGTAMGTCMAPSYANIFMGSLEKRFLDTCQFTPLIWLRYIDDIFLIWTHGRDKLDSFIQFANSFHQTIKFTSNISYTNIPFLDIMVSLKDGFLQTDLYSKPTDTFNYLHWSSCHPFHTKKNIPYSLAFRLVRICSSKETLSIRLNELRTHLKIRGYPNKQIETGIKNATNYDRSIALKRTPKSDNKRIPFVVTFNPALPNLPSILRKLYPILTTSHRCQEAIPEVPMIAYRRPRNIKDDLVRSKIPSVRVEHGFKTCSSNRCKTCPQSSNTTTFTSTVTDKTYNIRHSLSCTSNNIIYLITCTLCRKQYVGQTSTPLRIRVNSHRNTIKHNNDTPVAKHFNLPNHSLKNVHIIAIDHVKDDDRHTRENKETFWIHTLKTATPTGINQHRQDYFPISQIV